MARPREGYRLKDGSKVPGASTVAKLISDPGGLLHWAWTEGVEGRDYRETRDKAASAGTIVHEAAEAWKHGVPYEWHGPPEIVAQAKVGYGAFIEWTQQTKLKIEQTEVSLVSETYRFGGTFDAILVGNKRVMCDLKTSASVYPEHLLQVSAYSRLWSEHHPSEPIEAFYILRFSRETGDFATNFYSNLDEAWTAFVHCRTLYDLRQTLAKRCR